MKIFIASDHGGFELKQFLVKKLAQEGYEVVDKGPKEKDPTDDYPQQTQEALKVLKEDSQNRAILICRNGVGVTIFANRFEEVRAGLSWSIKHAISHRKDDNTNVLTLPADYISRTKALKITKAWLTTPFSTEERHKRRINQIETLSK